MTGYSASNSVSAVSDIGDAPALIDAATEAGANKVSGPGLSSSERGSALPAGACEGSRRGSRRAEVLAKAAGRSLGEISTIVEGGAGAPSRIRGGAAADAASTPIVPGTQETTATIAVTFSLR